LVEKFSCGFISSGNFAGFWGIFGVFGGPKNGLLVNFVAPILR